MPGQFGPEWGGQFDAESVINYRRNQVVNFSGISTLMADLQFHTNEITLLSASAKQGGNEVKSTLKRRR